MRKFFRILKYLLGILVIFLILPYLLCPFYEYPEIKPFTGKMFYNPYEKIDSTAWRKANFHAHSRQWRGITAGSHNSAETVAARYKEINFDIVCISDYQNINTLLASEKTYIPVYEHGFGVTKTHQLVIGATDVSWKEYIIFQNYHIKQDIINSLKKDNEVISINHPRLRNAYTPNDLKYLKGYDLIEASSHSYFNATDLWDSALTAGNPVFAIGNDDNHDIYDPADYGYVYNMINCSDINIENIKTALRDGKAFVVELEPKDDASAKMKIEQSSLVPVITVCSIINDTLEMKFSRICDTLRLIGQNGILRNTLLNTDHVRYSLKETDTYIRAEIGQKNMTRVYLNPVFRYNGTIERVLPQIDYLKTWFFRAIYIIIVSVIIILYLRSKRKKRIIKN